MTAIPRPSRLGGSTRKCLTRVIDESSEDYLYPQKLFATVNLPVPVVRAIAA